MRAATWAHGVAGLLVLVAAAAIILAPGAVSAQAAAAIAPHEIDGQINGKKARFVAQGDDVLLSVAEAERVGLDYRSGKAISIGGTPLWVVTLDAVTVDGRTRLTAPAGVVPSIDGYFVALRAHPAEAFARSREVQAEINGASVKAYDLGVAGVLVAPAEAERVQLKYRDGKRQSAAGVVSWLLDAQVRIGSDAALPMAVTVAEPEAFFASLMTLAAPRQADGPGASVGTP